MTRRFCNRETRDMAYRDLLSQGISKRNITRASIRNQLIHPQYIEDYPGAYETGFGNTDYKTHFAVLYELRIWR